MANSLHLSREVKVYVEFGSNIWEIPVLNGFSFSQSTNISDVTLAEFADGSGTSRRGRRSFTDSVAPAEFSFSTYARPYKDGAVYRAVEEVLWAMFAGVSASAYAANGWTDGLTQVATLPDPNDADDIVGVKVDLNSSNKLVFENATIYFKFPGNSGSETPTDLWYKLDKCVLTEASMDFDIDGITTINWSGQAQTLIEPDAAPNVSSAITAGTTLTSNFIRNRLTQLSVVPNLLGVGEAQQGKFQSAYNVVLTGGSISMTNEVSFVTPESLGLVNTPLAPVMGSRSISGSFTCYLDHNSNSSADLLEDLLEANTIVTNSFKLIFDVGGTGATPGIRIRMPQALIEVPTHSIEDVISVETNFHALPSDIADTDELTISYIGPALP